MNKCAVANLYIWYRVGQKSVDSSFGNFRNKLMTLE